MSSSPSGRTSGRQGIRTPIPRRETALAVRPGQPYPATFPSSQIRTQVDHRGVEPRFPGCRPGVVPLDQQPSSVENQQRSARESNSVPLLTRKGCRRRTRGPSCFTLICPGWDSNPQAPEFKPGRSTDWRTWTQRRKRWDSNPQAASAATCFLDRLLIRPVRFLSFVQQIDAGGRRDVRATYRLYSMIRDKTKDIAGQSRLLKEL